MNQLVESFLHKFHSLEGVTLAQRRKNFFTLLHESAFLEDNAAVLDSISTNLKPITYLESLLKLEFLIYFRRTQQLFQLLQEGNAIFVSKIVKQIWFFKEYFNEMGSDELVNDILPNMSFSVRMKVLRKLSKCLFCEQFDNIFDAVATRYGIFIALKFITGCSPSKIRQLLDEYSINLSSTELRILHGKDCDLIDFYFTHSKYSLAERAYKKFVKFIFTEDRNLHNYLIEKYNIGHKFGQRATKKFVAARRDDVIKHPTEFKYLNLKAVIRKLGKDSVEFLRNALPENFEKYQDANWLLQYFPKRYHYSLYFKIIPDHYNVSYAHCPGFISETLLDLVANNEERAVLAKIEIDRGNDKFIKYLTTKDSIPLIKEKIRLTSDISERCKLVEHLVETCYINKDIDALRSVIKYYCLRRRKDKSNVHLLFIDKIENLFGFKHFNENMWNYLITLVTTDILKCRNLTLRSTQTLFLASRNAGISAHQKLSYLEFLYKQNQSIHELMVDYFTAHSEFPRWTRYDKTFEKYFLLNTIHNVAHFTSDGYNLDFNCRLIDEINEWNKRHKNFRICFYDFPVLVETFDYVIENLESKYYHTYSCVQRAFRNEIFTTKENAFREKYLTRYWEDFVYLGNSTDLRWFLIHEPLTVLDHLDQFFQLLVRRNSRSEFRLWHLVKKFSHLQLDEQWIEKCLAKLNDDKQNVNYVESLSVLMKPENYAAFANLYKPLKKKCNLMNKSQLELHNLRCSLGQFYKNTKSWKVVSCLLGYCVDDYCNYSLRSLSSLLYHTPENMLPQYLNYLSKETDSLRKHTLFLTSTLCSTMEVEKMFNSVNKQEIEKHLLSTVMKYFVKNPTESSFELLKVNMLFISRSDDKSLKSIIENLDKVPKKYLARYIHHSWKYFDETVGTWQKLSRLKRCLLSTISMDVMVQLPLEFGIKIIKEHFMTNKPLDNINHFIVNFVKVQEKRTLIFETVFGITDQCQDQFEVFNFFQFWYREIMKSKEGHLKYVEPFVNHFESKVNMTDNFPDFVKIYFLRRKIEWSDNQSVDNLLTNILIFFESAVSNYGSHVIYPFAEEMHLNVSYFFDTREKMCDFYSDMIKRRLDLNVALLLLHILTKFYSDRSALSSFGKILDEIKNINDSGTRINLLWKFKDYLAQVEL
jgi:hypothetical protein